MSNNNPAPQFKPDALSYNTMGYRPVSATYNLDCEQIEKAIEDIASREIDGIVQVTHQHDIKTGAVGWFIWFDSKGDHFVDKSTNNTAINQSIRRFSPKFKDFANKFGWRESDDDPRGSNKVNLGNIVGNNADPSVSAKLTYLQVALSPFLIVMFDVYGAAFGKQYGVSNPPKVIIERKYRWMKGSSGDFHRLVGIQVEKTLRTAFKQDGKPKAKRSGHFN